MLFSAKLSKRNGKDNTIIQINSSKMAIFTKKDDLQKKKNVTSQYEK